MRESIRTLGRRLGLGATRERHREALLDLETLARRPLISLVMPTYNTEPRWLREAIDSVLAQVYPDWELCIADDGSTARGVRRTLERYSEHPRVRCALLERNAGISAASNRALELCEGEYVGFIDHDDALTPDALLRVAQALDAGPGLDVVYSDSDKLTADGRRADPFLKPDWSPVYALGAMYIGHLLVARRSLVEAAGGFDPAFDTIQDFELMLRLSERTDRIHHIPRILYHWRAIPGSIAAGAEQKSGVPELQARAVSAHLERIGVPAAAVPHETIPHRARLIPADGPPPDRVSVVLPWRTGARRALGSLRERTTHPDVELIVVHGLWSEEEAPAPEGLALVEDDGTTFSPARAFNLGWRRAAGGQVVFLREWTEIAQPDWLEQLLLHAALPGVVAVGPLLVRPDGAVEAAGTAIGLREPADRVMAGFPADGDGYYGSLPCAREVAALSAACLMVRRDALEGAGGFDEHYSLEYEDLDLCQRLRTAGGRVVYTPRPRVVSHLTPAARRRGTDIVDRALFVDNWWDELVAGDPFYNPGFARAQANYEPR